MSILNGRDKNNVTVIADQEVSLSIDSFIYNINILSNNPETLSPKNWKQLTLAGPHRAPNTTLPLQNNAQAYAVYNRNERRWRIQAQDAYLGATIFGVVLSRTNGIRLIQLPNLTNQTVIGIIDAYILINLFGCPQVDSQSNEIILNPYSKCSFPFISVLPLNTMEDYSKNHNKHHHQYTYYYQDINSSNNYLSWTAEQSQHQQREDHSKFKSILKGMKSQLGNSGNSDIALLTPNKKQNIQKRLLLLQHQINGLQKRKISHNSNDMGVSRSLDYTSLLNEKENQINSLNKNIESLKYRLNQKEQHEGHYKKQIERLKEVLNTVNNPLISREEIDNLLISQVETMLLHKSAVNLEKKAKAFGKILRKNVQDLKLKGVKIDIEQSLNSCLDGNIDIDVHINEGIVNIIQNRDKIIQVPVQDDRTRELIKIMGIQICKIYAKYPKIKEEADIQFLELLNREVLTIIDIQGFSNIVQIIKFIPSIIKVENIFVFNEQKQRRIQFYLRVLLKALLDQLILIKQRMGWQFQIDQAILQMIYQQIGDAIIVQQIINIFQINNKVIVQIPQYIQKIVDRIIEVPVILPVQKIVQKIVQIIKIQEVEKVIYVPIEVVKFVDRIVQKIVRVEEIVEVVIEIPKIIQKIVEKRIQIPTIIEVQIIREKIIEIQKPVIIQKIINYPVTQILQVQVLKQETIIVKQIVQKIVQVEVIVQKIVEVIIQKPMIIEIERIVQKCVNVIQYMPAKEINNYIECVPQIIERIVQRIVPVIQRVQKIKEVPKCIDKIIEVIVQVPTIQEVKIIQQKIVYVDRIKEVQVIVQTIVPMIKEVIIEIQKRVQVPIIQEKIITVVEYVEKIVPYKWEKTKIVQVEKIIERIVQVIKIMEVQKPVFKYVTVEKPVRVCVQKIVDIPRIVQRIKQIRVPVQKIIQKLVQVPKVVEIQKIVQRIVVVPRVVQKIVEVPQIIQVIVQKIVQVQVIVQVIKQVCVPIIQQRIIQIQVIKYIQVPIYTEIEIIKQKIIPIIQEIEVIKCVDVFVEKIVQCRIQIPTEIIVEKLINQIIEVQKIIQIQKPFAVPFEMPVVCDRIIEKLIVVEKQVDKIVQIPVYIDKLIEVIVQIPTIQQIVKIEEKSIIWQKIKQIQKVVPYMNEVVVQIQVIREKPVLTPVVEEVIVQVQAFREKIVQVIRQVAKIYEIDKFIEKIVQVPRYMEIIARQPVVIINNRIIQKILQKIVQVIVVEQQIVQVPTIQEKIIVTSNIVKEILEIQVLREIFVPNEIFIQCTNIQNVIQTQIEIIQRFQERIVPVNTFVQRFIQIPMLLQKVVERIILMPQVHQITQRIIDIRSDTNIDIDVDIDIDIDFDQYRIKCKDLCRTFEKDIQLLIQEIIIIKGNFPQLCGKIEFIQKYIKQLRQIIEFFRKSKSCKANFKKQAFYLVLIEKLIKQMRRLKRKHDCVFEDVEIDIFFFNQNGQVQEQIIRTRIEQFKKSKEFEYINICQNNQWSEILYDKFYLLDLLQKQKLQKQRFRILAEQRLQLLYRFKQNNDILYQRLRGLEQTIAFLIQRQGLFDIQCFAKIKEVSTCASSIHQLVYTDIGNLKINELIEQSSSKTGPEVTYRIQQSRIRQLQAQVQLLRKEYLKKTHQAGTKLNSVTNSDKNRVIDSLRKTIVDMTEKGSKSTIHDEEKINSVESIQLKSGRRQSQPSLAGFSFNSPNRVSQQDWDQYPIFKFNEDNEGKQDLLGRIMLFHGKVQKDLVKSFNITQNTEQNSYTLMPSKEHQYYNLKPAQITIEASQNQMALGNQSRNVVHVKDIAESYKERPSSPTNQADKRIIPNTTSVILDKKQYSNNNLISSGVRESAKNTVVPNKNTQTSAITPNKNANLLKRNQATNPKGK